MEVQLSPKYMMSLISKVKEQIWNEFSSYQNVMFYISKWHQSDDYGWENFYIIKNDKGTIDLDKTLHAMDGTILLKIAIDLGVETPDFIPCVPQFKNDLKVNYKSAAEAFDKSFKNVEENPDLAVGLANSALESIIKEIVQDVRLGIVYDKKKTLYDLTKDILKALLIFPDKNAPTEIRNIGSSMMTIAQNVEALRSEKTLFHGKTAAEYVVTDTIFAKFTINTISTVGLFLIKYYKSQFPIGEIEKSETDNDLPF